MSMETAKKNKKWIIGGIVYAILLFVILTVSNLDAINIWLGKFWLILRPVVFGLLLAYLLNPFFRFYERRVFCRLKLPVLRRGISLLLSYLTLLLIIICLIWMILPQLLSGIFMLVDNYHDYVHSTADFINGFIHPINDFMETITKEKTTFDPVAPHDILDFINGMLPDPDTSENGLFNTENLTQITSIFSTILKLITDWLLAIFISLYFLASKEKRHAQIMRFRNAIFSDKVNGRISRVIYTLDHSFGGFFKGKIFESLIVWLISYALFAIIQIPYAFLFSAFLALMNIIPIIGTAIAAFPIGFLILLVAPAKFIPFLLIIILIIQIDGNIIAPKVLGDNTGVSALCVIIALATMGSIWGFVGMILGVPLFASILKLSDHFTEKRLQSKGLPAEIESYYSPDALVDPAKDSHKSTDKMVKRLEKNILRIQQKLATQKRAELCLSDRFMLRTYEIALKYKIITPTNDETIIQFYSEQQQEQFVKRAEARIAKAQADNAEEPQVSEH